MSDGVVRVTIDGRTVEARPGELVIAAAERHGVHIPRFCWHPRMREVGMCRMCLVDIDAGRGPALQPACMVPVADGMTVETASDRARRAQEGVLELLLVNHPLDCPVCDKGGECPLQDQAFSHGPGESRFVEEKVHYAKPIPVSDLVLLDRERCILCDRCTRFAAEVAGDPLISFINRGVSTEVNTFPDHPFASHFSGNTVQICPVGALTAVPYRFRARPWDLAEDISTCTTCAVGCRIAVQSSRNRVLRHLGVDVDEVNWGWLCDKGRFAHDVIDHPDRLGAPLRRRDGELTGVRWSEALDAAAEALSGAERVAVLGGARCTNESAYAWAWLAKGILGTDDVDCRMGDGLAPGVVYGLPRATINEVLAADVVVVISGDLKEELPVLWLRLRDAAVGGRTRVLELSAVTTTTTPLATCSLRHRPGELASAVAALCGDGPPDAVSGDLDGARRLLDGAATVGVIIGRTSLAEPEANHTIAAAALAARRPDARLLPVLRRANTHGALDAGLAPGLLPGRVSLDDGRDAWAAHWGSVPERTGRDAAGILRAAADGQLDALVLVGADPLTDFCDRDLAERGLAGARTVIAVDIFPGPSASRADIVLAAAGPHEVDGTTTNIEGRVSVVRRRVTPPGTARADWEIALELAERLGRPIPAASAADLWDDLAARSAVHAGVPATVLAGPVGESGIVIPPAPGTVPEGTPVAAPARAGVDRSGSSGSEPVDGDGQGPDAGADPGSPAGEGAAAPPVPFSTIPPPPVATPPPPPSVDRYSLRLVTERRLYDGGVLVSRSPALSALARGARARLHPAEADRLGLEEGEAVRLRSPRGSVVVPAHRDPGVPEGTVVVTAAAPDSSATRLIDADAPVTVVRAERPEAGGDR